MEAGEQKWAFFHFNYSSGARIVKWDEFLRDRNLQLQGNAHCAFLRSDSRCHLEKEKKKEILFYSNVAATGTNVDVL